MVVDEREFYKRVYKTGRSCVIGVHCAAVAVSPMTSAPNSKKEPW